MENISRPVLEPSLFSSYETEDQFLAAVQAGLRADIFEDCYSEGPVKVCVDVDLDQACAEVYLVGVRLARACVDWTQSGKQLHATIGLPTVNSGVWKLERPTLTITHHITKTEGRVGFTATLYKLEFVFPKGFVYREKRKWEDVETMSW